MAGVGLKPCGWDGCGLLGFGVGEGLSLRVQVRSLRLRERHSISQIPAGAIRV